MSAKECNFDRQIYSNFRIFLELMANKITEILLVSSPYDAFIIEEDGTLASRIINEYSGLNLSKPPRITWTSSPTEALSFLRDKPFDMVIITPHLDDMDPFSLARKIKGIKPELPVNLLAYSTRGIYPPSANVNFKGIDKVFIWSGNSDLLLALVKNAEDSMNVDYDTGKAGVRVIILIEDSPVYYSILLPHIYKEVVGQTQAVLQGGLNEEHRLLTMRARPKILLAENYEEALKMYSKYRPYLLGLISDTSFPRKGIVDDDAGSLLLSKVRQDLPYLPLLLISTDPNNKTKAERIQATFIDKNSPNLTGEIHEYFIRHLGFGDFIFRTPEDRELGRAANLHELERMIKDIPDESLLYHAERNHFSNWIMARSEIALASVFKEVFVDDFDTVSELREYILSNIHMLRKRRQKGVISQFNEKDFDPDINDFITMGHGSLGGKARGLAFMAELLLKNPSLKEKYPDQEIEIPQSLVLCTDIFEEFMAQNELDHLQESEYSDEYIKNAFVAASMPPWVIDELESYLTRISWPLAVRSSSLLQDSLITPPLGLYKNVMLRNNSYDIKTRLKALLDAVKLIYASTYFKKARDFFGKISRQPQKEMMAVIVQRLSGDYYNDFFYPAISGKALSYNYYPVSYMKPEEGIATMVVGFGKSLKDNETALRFSPEYPQVLPQFSTVDNILKSAQKDFFALRIKNGSGEKHVSEYSGLERRRLNEASSERPVQVCADTYVPDQHYIRETGFISGPKVLTFSRILKDQIIPLPSLISDLLKLGRKSLGGPVEIEFTVNLDRKNDRKATFNVLRIKPMTANEENYDIRIGKKERRNALCYSTEALGNGTYKGISDIVYVRSDSFRIEKTIDIAREIGKINALLTSAGRPYLLIGPGRWGSSDRWLGIPVTWNDISAVGAIVELRNKMIKADASKGYHFFSHITSQGIPYLTVTEGTEDFLDYEWLENLTLFNEMDFIRHGRIDKPLLIKSDGINSQGIISKID